MYTIELTSSGSAGSVTTSQIVPLSARSEVARAKPTSRRFDISRAVTSRKECCMADLHLSSSREGRPLRNSSEFISAGSSPERSVVTIARWDLYLLIFTPPSGDTAAHVGVAVRALRGLDEYEEC